MNLGSAIKEIRKSKGITQAQLANKCGMSVNAICSIEINLTFPKQETISNICESLGVSKSYLLVYCLDEYDVLEDKRSLFNLVHEEIKDLLKT